MPKINLFLISSLVLIVTSYCDSIMYKMYGIKKLQVFDDSLYNHSLNSMIRNYSGSYYSIVSHEDEFKNYHMDYHNLGDKNIKQPIQILYFKEDSLLSFRANCYAKGNIFGQLDWNYNGAFDSFVPESAIHIAANTPNLRKLFETYHIPEEKRNDVTILFFWNNMLLKQSKSAFETIVKNINVHSNLSDGVSIILINTDKPYINFFKE